MAGYRNMMALITVICTLFLQFISAAKGADTPEPPNTARDAALLGKLLGSQVRLKLHKSGHWLYASEGFVNFHLLQLQSKKVKDFDARSRFNVVPGLAGQGVSLQSVAFPNSYICTVEPNSMNVCHITALSTPHATWRPRAGLADKRHVSYESLGKPGYYLSATPSTPDSVEVRQLDAKSSSKLTRGATWELEATEGVRTTGEWVYLYGKDRVKKGDHYTLVKEIGTVMSHTDWRWASAQQAWEAAVQAQGKVFPLAMKHMYTHAGEHSVTQVSAQAFGQLHQPSDKHRYTMKPGAGFYLWQWVLHCWTADGTHLQSYTPLHQQTNIATAPPRPAPGPN